MKEAIKESAIYRHHPGSNSAGKEATLHKKKLKFWSVGLYVSMALSLLASIILGGIGLEETPTGQVVVTNWKIILCGALLLVLGMAGIAYAARQAGTSSAQIYYGEGEIFRAIDSIARHLNIEPQTFYCMTVEAISWHARERLVDLAGKVLAEEKRVWGSFDKSLLPTRLRAIIDKELAHRNAPVQGEMKRLHEYLREFKVLEDQGFAAYYAEASRRGD